MQTTEYASYTIEEFCKAERISRAMYYKLARMGKAPRHFNVGAAVRISPEARLEWRREREAETAHQENLTPARRRSPARGSSPEAR
jgi:hypothetical protein